jgi:hypothetical protein
VALHSGTYEVQVGIRAAAVLPASGKFYRAQILNGIDGPPVLDVDCSQIGSGSATSFTALTGQTVTINRSTSGRKAVAVTHPVWLFGTDDYMEVSDNDLIDFGASDSFTVLWIGRAWDTYATSQTLIAKRAAHNAANAGYSLASGITASEILYRLGDGSAQSLPVSAARTSGLFAVAAGVRNVATDNATVYLNGTVGTPATDNTTTTLANAEALRVGRLSGAGTSYGDQEFIAAAIFRRALTSDEISTITTYYQGRVG